MDQSCRTEARFCIRVHDKDDLIACLLSRLRMRLVRVRIVNLECQKKKRSSLAASLASNNRQVWHRGNNGQK